MSIRNRSDTPRRGVLPAALLACVVAAQAIGEEPKTAAADPPADALAALNDASRAAYHRAKEQCSPTPVRSSCSKATTWC